MLENRQRQEADVAKPLPDSQPTAPRPRGRPKGTQERRTQILRAALAVFGEAGYERATMQDIVQRAGTSKGALYHYFESKEAVLMALLREFLTPAIDLEADVIAHAAPSATSEQLLEQLVGRIWEILRDPDRLALARLAVSEMPKLPEVGRLYFDEVVTRGRAMLRQAMLHGRTPDAAELEHIDARLSTLQAMLVGAALVRRAFEPFDPGALAHAEAGRIVTQIVMRGIVAPEDPRAETASTRRE
jgi:AcrR family transcriptional regulator